MKAYISDAANIERKGQSHGSKLRLTIGMIVKNEEKTLDKCLKSLMPLLEQVPSELIITDTGSTDSTVEIAKKYTDNIIHFEWCDDFSAARNTGLRVARGEWFMIIDGDEWFEDVNEIIEFFNSGKCDDYGSASYKQRNYLDKEGKAYKDFFAARIYKSYVGMHFANKIHEAITRREPTQFLDAYVHHFGYIEDNQKDSQDKFQRNTKLLEEMLEENPRDLRSLMQLAEEYGVVRDFEKSIEYNRKGLELEKKYPNKIWKISFQHNLLKGYFNSGAYQKVLDALEEFAVPENCDEIDYLDFYFSSEVAAYKLGKHEEVVRLGQKYLNVYEKYQDHQLDMTRLLYTNFSFVELKYKEEAIRMMGWGYLLQNDNEQAIACLKRLDLLAPHSIQLGLHDFCFAVAGHSGKWKIISEFYNDVLSCGDKEKKDEFIDCTEAYIISNPKTRYEVFSALSESESSDDYVALCRLRCSEELGERKNILECLNWFFSNEIDWNLYFSDVLYFAMKEKINILPFVLQIDMDALQYYVAEIKKSHLDFISVIQEYFEAYSFENLKGLYWTICLEEVVVLGNNDMDEEKSVSFFEDYARLTALYVRSVYRNDLFVPNAISILPRACRFGYYMGEAFLAEKMSNDVDYLKNLHWALSSYPVMDKPISLLLDRYQRKMEKEKNVAAEFTELAQQIKNQIEAMLKNGNIQEAGSATEQLAALLPDDVDVRRFQKLTHTEPTMKELASRFPQ